MTDLEKAAAEIAAFCELLSQVAAEITAAAERMKAMPRVAFSLGDTPPEAALPSSRDDDGMEAWAVIRNSFSPQPPSAVQPRKRAVLDALKKRNGQSIGSLVNAALEILGEDSEDMVLRKRMCGLINTLAEEGSVTRHTDGTKEVFSINPD